MRSVYEASDCQRTGTSASNKLADVLLVLRRPVVNHLLVLSVGRARIVADRRRICPRLSLRLGIPVILGLRLAIGISVQAHGLRRYRLREVYIAGRCLLLDPMYNVLESARTRCACRPGGLVNIL